eukprot:4229817-Amphidinium_carterae.2
MAALALSQSCRRPSHAGVQPWRCTRFDNEVWRTASCGVTGTPEHNQAHANHDLLLRAHLST